MTFLSIHLQRAKWLKAYMQGLEPTSNAGILATQFVVEKGFTWLETPIPRDFPVHFTPARTAYEKERRQNEGWMEDPEFYKLTMKKRHTIRFEKAFEHIEKIIEEHGKKSHLDQSRFEQNFEKFSADIGLNTTERELVLLIGSAHEGDDLKGLMSYVLNYEKIENPLGYIDILSRMMGAEPKRIAGLLQQDSPLQQLRVVRMRTSDLFVNNASLTDFRMRLFTSPTYSVRYDLYPYFILRMLDDTAANASVAEMLIGPEIQTKLTYQNFAHAHGDLDPLLQTLKGLQNAPDDFKGRAVGLYGPPGTGKTELAQVLAKKLGLTAHKIGTTKRPKDAFEIERLKKDSGEFTKPSEPTRLERIEALQNAVAIIKQLKLPILLIVDEADDILDVEKVEKDKEGSKEFINDLLLGLDVPVVFICNDPSKYAEATVRRILPMTPVLLAPHTVRRAMIENAFETANTPFDNKQWEKLDRIAGTLTPATIGRILEQARLSHPHSNKPFQTIVEDSLATALRAMNGGITPVIPPAPDTTPFVSEAYKLKRHSAENLIAAAGGDRKKHLFYGEIGTGKKRLAKEIAHANNRYVVEKSVAELTGMFGLSEELVFDMFERARIEQAVLIIKDAELLIPVLSATSHNFTQRLMAHPGSVILCADTVSVPRQMELLMPTVHFEAMDMKARFHVFESLFHGKPPERLAALENVKISELAHVHEHLSKDNDLAAGISYSHAAFDALCALRNIDPTKHKWPRIITAPDMSVRNKPDHTGNVIQLSRRPK